MAITLARVVSPMTGILVLAGVILLLMLALEPAHRRTRLEHRTAYPGLHQADRDWERVKAELRASAVR
jgi:hypothetical protein